MLKGPRAGRRGRRRGRPTGGEGWQSGGVGPWSQLKRRRGGAGRGSPGPALLSRHGPRSCAASWRARRRPGGAAGAGAAPAWRPPPRAPLAERRARAPPSASPICRRYSPQGLRREWTGTGRPRQGRSWGWGGPGVGQRPRTCRGERGPGAPAARAATDRRAPDRDEGRGAGEKERGGAASAAGGARPGSAPGPHFGAAAHSRDAALPSFLSHRAAAVSRYAPTPASTGERGGCPPASMPAAGGGRAAEGRGGRAGGATRPERVGAP